MITREGEAIESLIGPPSGALRTNAVKGTQEEWDYPLLPISPV
jgi:hypothetical protein